MSVKTQQVVGFDCTAGIATALCSARPRNSMSLTKDAGKARICIVFLSSAMALIAARLRRGPTHPVTVTGSIGPRRGL